MNHVEFAKANSTVFVATSHTGRVGLFDIRNITKGPFCEFVVNGPSNAGEKRKDKMEKVIKERLNGRKRS